MGAWDVVVYVKSKTVVGRRKPVTNTNTLRFYMFEANVCHDLLFCVKRRPENQKKVNYFHRRRRKHECKKRNLTYTVHVLVHVQKVCLSFLV